MTPTRQELARWADTLPATSPEEVVEQVRSLRLPSVLVKGGAEGMVWVRDDTVTPIPPVTVANEPDPVGAGDATIAALGCGLGIGWELAFAAKFGSCAGAVAASRFGSLPPTLREIEIAQGARRAGTYLDQDALELCVSRWKSMGSKVGLVHGSLDSSDAGWEERISWASGLVDRVVAVIHSCPDSGSSEDALRSAQQVGRITAIDGGALVCIADRGSPLLERSSRFHLIVEVDGDSRVTTAAADGRRAPRRTAQVP